MNKKIDIPLILLAIAGFLAPLIGGQVSVEALAMNPGGDPWINALTGASETPTLSHAILALLCTAALVIMLLQRKILQVPNTTFSGIVMVLLALILTTIGYSSFKGVSLPAAVEWLTYGIALYAVVAAGGRQKGPTVILSAIFAGCVLLALLGIREYGSMKFLDPTWRIFPQWVGPNAMAAILVVGLFLGLGLSINAERAIGLGIALGCVAIGLALFLTQSKGALAAMLVCMALFGSLLAFWLPRREKGRAMATIGGTVAVIGLLVVAMSMQSKAAAATQAKPGEKPSVMTPGDRFVNAGASADQSVGFRKLLWQTSVKLMERNPLGSGIGTFQFESARPGLTTQTHFAHETYLQLGAEASALAPLLLLAAMACWGRLLLRGGSKLQSHQNVLRASVFAAVVSVAIHSLIDSDLSYFGVGLVMFLLFGIGLLLSSDAVAPEYLPAALRRVAAAGIALIAGFMLFLGVTEAARAQARAFMTASTINDAQSRLDSLRSTAPWDAEVWYLSAQVAQDQTARLEFAKNAVAAGPSTRNLRFLAKIYAGTGMYSDALGAIQRAVQVDPNNLSTLSLLKEIQEKMGDEEKAKQTLQSIVDVEKTQYFKVRSLPELVETLTFAARIELASKTTDAKEKIALLQPAVDGFKQYLSLTVPNVVRFAHNTDGALPYGGEDLKSAEAKMLEAATAAKTLAEAYRSVGDLVKGAAADADAAEFGKPLDLPSAK